MKFLKIRFLKISTIVVISCVVLLYLSGRMLSYYARQKIASSLKSIGGTVGTIDINLFTQTISIKKFDLRVTGDSIAGEGINTIPHTAQIKSVIFRNVSLYDLLINKEINIHKIILDEGSIRYNSKITSEPITELTPLKRVSVDYLILRNLKAEVVSDSLTEYAGTINTTLHSIHSSDTATIMDIKAYTLKNIEARISKILINYKNQLYRTKIADVYLNSREQKLVVDSFFLQPRFPKYKFAKAAGKQTDRVNVFIPKIEVQGLHYISLNDSLVTATSIDISSAEVYSFRDKRMPFRETKKKPLPMEALKNLAFAIQVDTLKIKNSKITYEEFPPEGTKSGKVIFENLQATLHNLRNRLDSNSPKHATLDASCKLMGKGLLRASFLLPLEDNQSYYAEGKITQMALYHLNPALENIAFISIESGKLNALDFNFKYTDRASEGTVIVNYEGLKISGLKKEDTRDKNNLKTFLMNLFVRKNKDKSVTKENRTGSIAFERDQQRQIFNYWWKSLLSGIKTSVLNPDGKKKEKE